MSEKKKFFDDNRNEDALVQVGILASNGTSASGMEMTLGNARRLVRCLQDGGAAFELEIEDGSFICLNTAVVLGVEICDVVE